MSYLILWLNHFLIHLGPWISFVIMAGVWREGPPKSVRGCLSLILTAALLGSVGALFSSHSHLQYNQLAKVLTKSLE
jgi:hypothetical protein